MNTAWNTICLFFQTMLSPISTYIPWEKEFCLFVDFTHYLKQCLQVSPTSMFSPFVTSLPILCFLTYSVSAFLLFFLSLAWDLDSNQIIGVDLVRKDIYPQLCEKRVVWRLREGSHLWRRICSARKEQKIIMEQKREKFGRKEEIRGKKRSAGKSHTHRVTWIGVGWIYYMSSSVSPSAGGKGCKGPFYYLLPWILQMLETEGLQLLHNLSKVYEIELEYSLS